MEGCTKEKPTHRALGDGAVNGYPQKLQTQRANKIRSRHDMKYDVCVVCYVVSSVCALRISQRGTTDRSIFNYELSRKLEAINIHETFD